MAKINCEVSPIETYQYSTPTSRPHYSLLCKAKIKKEYGIVIPHWKDSLKVLFEKARERFRLICVASFLILPN